MKFKLFFAIAGISLLGCKSDIAIKYNDMIVKEQNKLSSGMDEAEPKLKNYFVSFEYDSIANVSNRMEAKIDSILQEIKNKPAPKADQGENFKKVALGYFNYFKSIYTSYKNYGLQTTAQGRLSVGQDLTVILSYEDKMIAELLEAQRIFAKDNNFKIKGANQNNSLVKK